MAKDLGGPVFLSHSSDDKEFVRKLDDALRNADFETWLDERQLVPGDDLPGGIATALANAGAVIVVISAASAGSDWLAYELRLCTDRMVRSGLRLVPVLLDSTPLPNELGGTVYADFTGSFEKGLELVLLALEQEVQAEQPSDVMVPFYKQAEEWVRSAFDGVGWASISGEYKSVDYDVAIVEEVGREDIEVGYDTAESYAQEPRPLNPAFYGEFLEETEAWGLKYHMLLTRRPPGDAYPALDGTDGRIRIIEERLPEGKRTRELFAGQFLSRLILIIDLSNDVDEKTAKELLERARDEISRAAQSDSSSDVPRKG